MRGLDRSILYDWYTRRRLGYIPSKLDSISTGINPEESYYACFTGSIGSQCAQFYFWYSDTEILVDWPRSVAYNTPTIKATVAQNIVGRRWFWVSRAELSNDYFFSFSGKEDSFQSISFYESGEHYDAYALRGPHDDLIELLGEKPLDLTLELAFGHLSEDTAGCFILAGFKLGHAEITP